MRVHVLSIVGAIVAAVCWLILLFGTYVRAGDIDVANLHLLTISSSIIETGLALMLGGIILTAGEYVGLRNSAASPMGGEPRPGGGDRRRP
jgi:hypothetical protein